MYKLWDTKNEKIVSEQDSSDDMHRICKEADGMSRIIAVDFDGTICKDRYPDIGEANETLINMLVQCQENGEKLILWTCRQGIFLQEAICFCKAKGLEFDAVNQNLPEIIEKYGSDSRKIYADLYLDDRAATVIWDQKLQFIA